MGGYELACRCNACGEWGAKNTSNLLKAAFKCKVCYKVSRIKRKGLGFNLLIRQPKEEELSELVSRLNQENNQNKRLGEFQ